MTIFRYISDTEAFQWDDTDATFEKITARLPKGWQSVSSCGVLLLYKISLNDYDAPQAFVCQRDWWIALDEYNVQLLRPNNFGGSYQRIKD